MLYTVAIVAGGLLAAILIFAATKPGTFRVQRAASIRTRPEKIFELIADFHKWASWSPWEKLDPAMKRTFTGAASGKGAVYAWAGNSKAGEGRMEITGASPGSKVTIKLDFVRPFESHNLVEFTLEERGEFTDVTWTMDGPQAYVHKVMCIFVSMDRMVGKDFEAGLANLKAIAEQ